MSLRFLLSAGSLLGYLSSPALAAQPMWQAPTDRAASAVETVKPWAPEPVFGGGFGGGEGSLEGGVFGVIPLVSTLGDNGRLGGDLWFVEPHANWQEQGASSQSLGLGFRRLFNAQSINVLDGRDEPNMHGFWAEGWYLGGELFFNTLQSSAGNSHWQTGLGLEAGSRYLTVRANYYHPLTDAKQTAAVTVERSRKWSLDVTHENAELIVHSRAISQPTGFNYIDSASVLSDATYTHHYRVRNDVFTYFEELTPSWDVEASMLIPRLDRYTDLRLIAGLYGMNSGEYSSANNGWRAGLEWRPVRSLALLASYNEDSSSDKGQWFAGFRVEITLGQTSKQLTQRRTRQLVERLLEPTGHFAGGRLMHGVTVDKQLLLYDVSSTAPYLARGKIEGAYIYLPGGRIYRILADGSLGPELRSTTDGKNEHGVLTVIPEPTRATLLLLGSFGLIFWRRRAGQ